MRKLVALILIFAISAMGVCVNSEGEGTNLELIITDFKAPSSITKNQQFTLELTVKNNSESSFDYMYVEFGANNSFSPVSKGSRILAKNLPGPKGETVNEFLIKYNGSPDSKLPISLIYKKHDSQTVSTASDFINLPVVPYTEPAPVVSQAPQPVDTSKYVPSLVIADTKAIPSGKAGEKITITLPVKNISSHEAKNVIITTEADDKLPIATDKMASAQIIDSIKSGETKEATVTFDVASNAQEKVYTLKLNLQYTNSYNDAFAAKDSINIKLLNSLKNSRVMVSSITSYPSSINAGEGTKVTVNIQNYGNLSANDIKVSLTGLKSDGFGLSGSTDSRYIEKMNGGDKQTLEFSLNSSSKMESGSYGLGVKVEYKDTSGTQLSEESQFFVSVNKREQSESLPDVSITNLTAPVNALKSGESFSVVFDIANTGTAKLPNLKVTTTSDKEIVPKSLSTKIIPVLEAGKTQRLKFDYLVTDEAVTKNYPISINIEYETGTDQNKTKQTANQFVGVYVEGKAKETDKKSAPKVIISRCVCSPDLIKPGTNFNLDITFQNTSKVSDISNLKIVLTPAEGVFIPVNSGGTIFIDSIPKGGSVQKSITMYVKPDAQTKAHPIAVDYDYEDDKATAITAKDTVSVPVNVEARMVIGEFSIPPDAFIGQPVSIPINFFNMGKTTVYNVLIRATGDFQIQSPEYYGGNFESGKSDNYELQLTPDKPGSQNGKIILAFEDANGKSQSIEKPFTINVMDQMPMDEKMPGMPEMPGQEAAKKGGINTLYLAIGGGVGLLVIGIIVFVVVRKVSRRRKEMAFDE
ncbi:MAG TPA: CARDB domain-containing protein [Pseudobacteroides sp.]|uniref:COG1361 S-layer family protein n=1 Tax=Pseudobacteroides sp. TaxID=1968840 RepID=UPI002F93F926